MSINDDVLRWMDCGDGAKVDVSQRGMHMVTAASMEMGLSMAYLLRMSGTDVPGFGRYYLAEPVALHKEVKGDLTNYYFSRLSSSGSPQKSNLTRKDEKNLIICANDPSVVTVADLIGRVFVFVNKRFTKDHRGGAVVSLLTPEMVEYLDFKAAIEVAPSGGLVTKLGEITCPGTWF